MIKILTVDNFFLVFQTACFLTSILLIFSNSVQFYLVILRFAFMAASVIIKILREIKNKNVKLLLKNQISFYLAYLLVAFEIIFLYQSMVQIYTTTLITWSILVIIIEGISFSLLMHEKTANLF